ncbi:hypothetical protein Patl1_11377 [Pistacia atlantica]|uniref:Uncharacterized protein n=1 Tax=Pistacia atlantica TaxID=434234 RepID=A0ACC1A586_9ROSI|nr:hypothetical protein Patl1_11377 [Pistacia atlantica]
MIGFERIFSILDALLMARCATS